MQAINRNIIVIIDLKPACCSCLSSCDSLCLFLFFLTMLWNLCFPIKNVEQDLLTRECRPTWLSIYEWGMTGKEQLCATHEPTLLYHDMTTGNKIPTAWQQFNVYWRGHKGITLPGNDVAVAKSKAKTRRFVESKNGLSLSQIVALFLPVFVGCRWIEKRLSPHFWAMSPVAKTATR